jgi:plastocyanin
MAVPAAALALLLALPIARAAPTSSVQGVVKIKGAKTSAGAVVSLHAPQLRLTPPSEPVTIEQKGFRFLPPVVAVQAGTTVRFVNDDPEPQDVYSPEGRYNLGVWPTGGSRDFVFEKPGAYRQLSNIHPDMLGWIVVLGTPLFAVTDEDGRFEIRDVPAGPYRLEAWYEERDGLEREIVVEPPEPLELELTVEK